MNLYWNDDERMLQEAATRFMTQRHPRALARAADRQSASDRLALWRELAGQGWPALLVPESLCGLGLGLRQAWIVAEAAGRHLLSLPLVANMVVLPTLCAAGADGVARQWLDAMMAGERYFAAAEVRPDGSAFIEGAADGVNALAVRSVTASRLELDLYAPVAAIAGLDPTMPVACQAHPQRQASVVLETAPGACRLMQSRLRLLRSAELIGAAAAALDMAAAYARERRQFDRPIGANQAIKHRLAQDWMTLDDARLAGMAAADAYDRGAASAERDSLFVPLLAVEGGCRVAHNAIQTHGALGVTWECDAHLYLKRVLRLAAGLQAGQTCSDLLERIWDSAQEPAPA